MKIDFPQVHGIFMPHGYAVCQKDINFIKKETEALKSLQIRYQFLNLTCLNDNGHLDVEKYKAVPHYAKTVRCYDFNQSIIGYINGHRHTHVLNRSCHGNIAETCRQLLIDGFDGILLDFEPLRNDHEFIDLLKLIREAIGVSSLLIVAAPAGNCIWSQSHIRSVASLVNIICPMVYDTSMTTINDYQKYVEETIVHYQCCYSDSDSDGTDNGTNNGNRINHDCNRNCNISNNEDELSETDSKEVSVIHKTSFVAQFMPILAAYSANEWHNPEIENIETGTSVVLEMMLKGYHVFGTALWWWYEMTPQDKMSFLSFVDIFKDLELTVSQTQQFTDFPKCNQDLSHSSAFQNDHLEKSKESSKKENMGRCAKELPERSWDDFDIQENIKYNEETIENAIKSGHDQRVPNKIDGPKNDNSIKQKIETTKIELAKVTTMNERICGSDDNGVHNLAKTSIASASSTFKSDEFLPRDATNGNDCHGWLADPKESISYLLLDLGEICSMNKMIITWGNHDWAIEFDILISTDETRWETIYVEKHGLGRKQSIVLENSKNGRYIKVLCKSKSDGWSYEIYEIEIF